MLELDSLELVEELVELLVLELLLRSVELELELLLELTAGPPKSSGIESQLVRPVSM